MLICTLIYMLTDAKLIPIVILNGKLTDAD